MKLIKSFSYHTFIVAVLLIGAGGAYAFSSRDYKGQLEKRDTNPSFLFRNLFDEAVESVHVYVTDLHRPVYTTTSIDYTIDGVQGHKELSGYLVNTYALEEYFYNLLFVVREEEQYIATTVLRFDPEARDFSLVPFVDREGNTTTDTCCGFITFQPRNYKNYDIVMYHHSKFSPKISKQIFQYNHDRGFIEQK